MARAKLPQSNLMVMKVCFSAATAGVQPLKYSAKELDRENGLDLFDSHARFYDSMIGRTTSQDPLAEKYSGVSPYLWCAANPIRNIDEGGDSIAVLYLHGLVGHLALLIHGDDGKWAYYSMNGTKFIKRQVVVLEGKIIMI